MDRSWNLDIMSFHDELVGIKNRVYNTNKEILFKKYYTKYHRNNLQVKPI